MNQTAADQWHLMIQSRPANVVAGPSVELNGRAISTLDLGGRPVAEPLPARFDDVFQALELLGMFVEGDGSFCWTAPEAAWRVFGEIYDGRETIQYMELKGTCPEAEFRQLLDCVCPGEPNQIMLQLVREGVHVEVEAFMRWRFGEAA